MSEKYSQIEIGNKHEANCSEVTGSCGTKFSLRSMMLLGTWYKKMLKCNNREMGHDGVARPFVCHVCSKSFSLQGNLDKHMVTHTGEKPYVCQLCGRAFSLQGNLKKHLITHTGDKPYVCIECGKAFSQNGNLVKHMAIHRGERPFTCDICGRSFTLRGNLKKHRATHGNDKPCECRACGRKFSLKGNLAKHEAIIHNIQRMNYLATRPLHTTIAKCICVYSEDSMIEDYNV